MTRPLCSHCLRPRGHCYCHLLPALENTWQLTIFQHRDESGHPLNTGRIAQLGLLNCSLQEVTNDAVIAPQDSAVPAVSNGPAAANPDTPCYLLYPGPEALPARHLPPHRPGRLLVLDAN